MRCQDCGEVYIAGNHRCEASLQQPDPRPSVLTETVSFPPTGKAGLGVGPTYYVRHPNETYSVADPRPIWPAEPQCICKHTHPALVGEVSFVDVNYRCPIHGAHPAEPQGDAQLATHLSHCNFGEYPGSCKYGEGNCPALTEEWSWFGHSLQRAENRVAASEQRERAAEQRATQAALRRFENIFNEVILSWDDMVKRGVCDGRMEAAVTNFERSLSALAQAAATDDEMSLRREVWLLHGHQGLYGDDGEMQCGECHLDYKRAPVPAIVECIQALGLRKLAAAPPPLAAGLALAEATERVVAASKVMMRCYFTELEFGDGEAEQAAEDEWRMSIEDLEKLESRALIAEAEKGKGT